ncbi:hypothetical protein F4780DRAFT_744342 [Xylariomycetidae sp. FL0641]|nr:hypothetical protein F4780DRAFT_744342 [Xylariomycetidae sp. FL0641]
MDKIAPEILHIVCSFLGIDDLLNFRLVGRAFADIGAAYMLPEVTFYMHRQELERLREISLHPIFSRNLCSLTYFAQALDCPKVSLREFLRDHKRQMRWNSKLKKLNLSSHQLLQEYKKYEEAAEQQSEIMHNRVDVALLKEVLPRFPNLQHITMSAGNMFYEGRFRNRRRKPLEDIMRGDNMYSLNPEGVRPFEALLLANAEAKCQLKCLRAGSLHWRFFRRSSAELHRMFRPLANLTAIEFIISVEPADERVHEHDSAGRCRKVLAKGALKNILKSMPQLRSLCVEVVSMECEDLDKGGELEHIIDPGFRWPNLRELVLGGIECERGQLTKVLELHKDSLQRLCLRDIYLRASSWKKLLPDIRKKLFLVEACICGDLYGHSEDGEEPEDFFGMTDDFGMDLEYWDLSVPEVGDQEMRDSINVYCRFGGHLYPDELPLSDEVVEKYYDDYVRGFFEDSEFEDDEDDEDGSLLALDGATDISGSSEDGWEDVESDEEISDDLEGSNTEDGETTEDEGTAVGVTDSDIEMTDRSLDDESLAVGMDEDSDREDETESDGGNGMPS